MKAINVKRIETLTAALLLALVIGCGQSKPPETASTEAAPAETPAAAAPATAAPAETPAAATPAAAPASGMARWDASPTGSKMRMEGTSTLHDWHMESTIIAGYLEAEADFPAKAGKAVAEVYTPVRSYKSSGGKKMDSVMQEHMKEPQFKKIEYRLLELKPKGAAAASGPVEFDAVGALTIIGNTVTSTMPVTIEKLADGKLKIVGKTPLKMSDYKLAPPEIKLPLLPDIKVGDDLKINFEWLLAPKA